MANREACELYIEQEIKSGLDAGKKPWTIGKELSGWVEKLFEVTINPKTIASRANRISSSEEKKSQPTETTTNPTPKTTENQRPSIIENRKPQGGGAREGAGRPLKADPVQPTKQSPERRATTRGSYEDWRKLKTLVEVVKSAADEMQELHMDAQHRIPARSMCESLAERFNKLAQKLVG